MRKTKLLSGWIFISGIIISLIGIIHNAMASSMYHAMLNAPSMQDKAAGLIFLFVLGGSAFLFAGLLTIIPTKMKTTMRFYLLIFMLLALGCSKEENSENSKEESSEKPEPENIIEFATIHAPALKNSMINTDTIQKAKVFLPPFYKVDTNINYPVVYFIHGFDQSYASDYGIFKTAYDEMVAGNCNEFIIVTVNSTCRLGGTFCVNSIVTGDWEEHISNEVIKYIDSNYRTIQRKESRGIAGFSMGGFGALYLGMRHADIYDLVYAMSPGVLNETDLRGAYNGWESDGGSFINAYGAVFSPNPELSYPYAEKPAFDGTEADSLIIERWKEGFGNFDKKVDAYLAGNERIQKFSLDFGTADYYYWIPRGCEYLAEIFETKGISYEIHSRPNGVHEVNIDQVKSFMLPFFSESLSFD